jgi:hypothetical protein
MDQFDATSTRHADMERIMVEYLACGNSKYGSPPVPTPHNSVFSHPGDFSVRIFAKYSH